MVYIESNNYENTVKVLFPRTKTGIISKIVFENQTDKSVPTFAYGDIDYQKNFYEVSFSDFSNVRTGQYNYVLKTDDGSVLSSGICQFNGFEPETVPTYSNNNQNIVQYNG